MDASLSLSFKLWDAQEAQRVERVAYVELNNTYLAVERGEVKLTITIGNRLRILVDRLFPRFAGDNEFQRLMNEELRNYWLHELIQLPGWNNV